MSSAPEIWDNGGKHTQKMTHKHSEMCLYSEVCTGYVWTSLVWKLKVYSCCLIGLFYQSLFKCNQILRERIDLLNDGQLEAKTLQPPGLEPNGLEYRCRLTEAVSSRTGSFLKQQTLASNRREKKHAGWTGTICPGAAQQLQRETSGAWISEYLIQLYIDIQHKDEAKQEQRMIGGWFVLSRNDSNYQEREFSEPILQLQKDSLPVRATLGKQGRSKKVWRCSSGCRNISRLWCRREKDPEKRIRDSTSEEQEESFQKRVVFVDKLWAFVRNA